MENFYLIREKLENSEMKGDNYEIYKKINRR